MQNQVLADRVTIDYDSFEQFFREYAGCTTMMPWNWVTASRGAGFSGSMGSRPPTRLPAHL